MSQTKKTYKNTDLYREIEVLILRVHLGLNHDHAGEFEEGKRYVIEEIAKILDKHK